MGIFSFNCDSTSNNTVAKSVAVACCGFNYISSIDYSFTIQQLAYSAVSYGSGVRQVRVVYVDGRAYVDIYIDIPDFNTTNISVTLNSNWVLTAPTYMGRYSDQYNSDQYKSLYFSTRYTPNLIAEKALSSESANRVDNPLTINGTEYDGSNPVSLDFTEVPQHIEQGINAVTLFEKIPDGTFRRNPDGRGDHILVTTPSGGYNLVPFAYVEG